MSKHFSIFQTDTQYQAAKNTLDYPNVSLIDTTGDLHYAKYVGQEVANAPFGSILMAEIATNKLFYIEHSADYNLTDYPLNNYEPIGICIFDKASRNDNNTVFLSLRYPSSNGTPQKNSSYMTWGDSTFATTVFDNVPGIKGNTSTSSIYINNYIKNTLNLTSSAAFNASWNYHTSGTVAGDWYLPSWYDVTKLLENYDTISNINNNIKTITGSNFIKESQFYFWCSSFYGSSNSSTICRTASSAMEYTMYTNSNAVRPVYICHPEEL